METIILKVKCSRCLGTGIDDNTGITCIPCAGEGYRDSSILDVTALMLLFNKMSSNLDDIMVKLDV